MARIIKFSNEIIQGSARKEFGEDFSLDLAHAEANFSDHTLCGIAFGEYVNLEPTFGKITCPDCIGVISYCKSFKKSKDY
jgi:hypothetical protein